MQFPIRSRPARRDGGDRLTILAGSTVALAGHSGAGKSTCAALLQRHWDPTGDTITIDSHDLRDLPLARSRRLIAAVPRTPTPST
ncbi:ATP-binding cassette domain-containing protein [Streptomyces sp. SA15]|uniref:ATP-binding cassette domain-containing protein n=1 Tax=Streptomyces sp. SA15 TaxID=934019 RepID=UPI0015C81F72|nr:ATP-binding cassette domain-containing protein [Streptomyces sp. SA15]